MFRRISSLWKNQWFLPLLLLSAGLLLRLTAFSQWGFSFDQVQIIEASKRIADGDLTLIGPRTGPASLFTGPLIYYLTAIFFLFGFGLYSLIATTLMIAATTGIVLYWLLWRYTNKKSATAVLFIWAFSLFLIRFDQVTWNPNFSLLASSLFFLPMYQLVRGGKIARLDVLFVLLGSFLSYQAHFSGFLFLPLSLLFFLSLRWQLATWMLLASTFGFTFSLLPTILFDFKNNWLNLQGFLNFASGIASNETSFSQFQFHTWKSFYTTFESVGALLFQNFSIPLMALFVLGLVFVMVYIAQITHDRNRSTSNFLPVIWIMCIAAIFSFYKGEKPPYYFIIQLPATFVILHFFLERIRNRAYLLPIAIVILITALSVTISEISSQQAYSIRSAVEVHRYLQSQTSESSIRSISLHVPFGETFGFDYILQDFPVSQEGGDDWYFSYPARVAFADTNIGGLSIWKQDVLEAGQKLHMNDEFRLVSTSNLEIYRDPYYSGDGWEGFVVFREGELVATIARMRQGQFAEKYPSIQLENSTGWVQISSTEFAWKYDPLEHIFVLATNGENQEFLHEDIFFF